MFLRDPERDLYYRQPVESTPPPPPPNGFPSTGPGGGTPPPTQPMDFNFEYGGLPFFEGSERPNYRFPGLPSFVPPQFSAPNPQDIINDPGYKFRLDQGSRALEQSAAARGVLRSGGTLKDILSYGQNFASQEYGNAFNRALESFDRQYRGAKDQYDPQLLRWQEMARAEQAAALAAYQREWQRYAFGVEDEFRNKQLAFEMLREPELPSPQPPQFQAFGY